MEKQFSQRKIKVAQYLRMSTEHQQYSLDNQSSYISDYANSHNMEVGYTYNDAGKSGLTISGRPGLKKLLDDAINKKIDIEAILVYDVSRFGRFPNIDEAAHYSYLLGESGVRIIYCAEPFSDEHPEMSMFGLSYQRLGAASYSRNLSLKVFAGQANLIRRGYHQGGMAGYGIRRLLIDEHHNRKEILAFRQRKSIQTDRVILIPGPESEVKIINRIFDMFIYQQKPEIVIASELNRQEIKGENDTRWTKAKIHQILTNEKYIGNNVYNKTSFKLKQKHTKNPENEWVRCNHAFAPIVSLEKFNLARDIILSRYIQLTNEELLDKLKGILNKRGKLSGFIIDEEDILPSSNIYRSRFGGLLRAYKLIGYDPRHDYSYIEINKNICSINKNLINEVIEKVKLLNGWVTTVDESELFCVNDEFTISIRLARCQRLASGKLRWKMIFNSTHLADVNIAIRMNSVNNKELDYYILPSIDEVYSELSLKENNSRKLELYRFDNLDCFLELVKRTLI